MGLNRIIKKLKDNILPEDIYAIALALLFLVLITVGRYAGLI